MSGERKSGERKSVELGIRSGGTGGPPGASVLLLAVAAVLIGTPRPAAGHRSGRRSPPPTVRPVGKLADLVLLDSDPHADIRNARDVFATVREGRPFFRADLFPLATGGGEPQD